MPSLLIISLALDDDNDFCPVPQPLTQFEELGKNVPTEKSFSGWLSQLVAAVAPRLQVQTGEAAGEARDQLQVVHAAGVPL